MRFTIPCLLFKGLLMIACNPVLAQSTGSAALDAAGGSRTIAGITHEYAIGQIIDGDTYFTGLLVVAPGVLQPAATSRVPEKTIGAFELQVFPNPVENTLFLLPAFRRAGTLQYGLYDAAGKLIFGREAILVDGTERQDLQISHIAAGQYILRVSWKAGRSELRTSGYKIQKMW